MKEYQCNKCHAITHSSQEPKHCVCGGKLVPTQTAQDIIDKVMKT